MLVVVGQKSGRRPRIATDPDRRTLLPQVTVVSPGSDPLSLYNEALDMIRSAPQQQ